MLSHIADILDYAVFTFNQQPITLADILLVPSWIILALWLSQIVRGFIKKILKLKNKDPNLIHMVDRVLYVLFLVVIFFSTLSLLNVPITTFAFLSGAIAIGFGFGAQNVINNFISGWILMWEKPIRIGDFLEVDGAKGVVEVINTRSTRIRRVDGVHILVPNSKLLENTVVNWTLVDKMTRTTVRVGVAYGSPVKKVAELLLQATREQPEVLTMPEPSVSFDDFGDNALMFESYFWINTNVEGGLRRTRSNIRFRLDELFAENNIVIAFPQRDVHLDGQITVVSAKNKTQE